jgi:surface protein
MQKYIFNTFLFCIFLCMSSIAQNTLRIQSPARITTSGAVQVVYGGGNFTNNGTYTDVAGTFKAVGGTTFSGTGTTGFYNATFDHNTASSVFSSQVSVNNQTTITAGNVDAGALRLYLRSDLNPNANLVNNGVLTGTVNGLVTKATVTSGTTTYSSTLSLNISGTSQQYQWQSSTDNSNWSNIASATSATYNSTVNSSTYYRCVLTTNNSAFSQNSPSVLLAIDTPFITRWDLSKTGSGPTQISFGIETSGTVNYTWQEVGGSGLSGFGTFTGTTATITGLPTGGIIDLSINPTNFQRININFGADRSRLTQLRQWGTVAWTSMQNAFASCNNFTLTAMDVPNLAGVTNMSQMFRGCSIFNQALLEGFNTAAVTDMGDMFRGCFAYNQPLPNSFNTAAVTNMSQMFRDCFIYNQLLPSSFNTAAVTNMSTMFANCVTYNQALPSSFNTEKVTNMSFMFTGCSAYNQPLPSSFNTATVTNMSNMFDGASAFNQSLPSSFNTSAVTNMNRMFAGCTAYNQPLPSGFNTAAVTNMGSMFTGCGAYNQPLPSSFNTAAVTDMGLMFNGATAFNQNVGTFNIAAATNMAGMFQNSGISVANYDAILTAWNTAGYINKNLGNASPLKYCASEADRANLVKPIADGGRGWTITGDGRFCGPPTIVVTGTITPFSACNGTSSAIQSFTVSGTNLTSDIVIGKLTGFQVSLTPGTTFENTLTLPQSGGTVPTTTIYVRMSRLATGLPSGNIAITSTGAITQNVALSGTVKALPVLNPSTNSPVCSGQTLFLYAKGENQSGVPSTDTYTWTGVNSFTANTQNPFIGNVGMNANGVYTVSATNSTNCSATATIRVTVKETPTLLISNFTNPTPENNPDGTISFTTNLPNANFSLSYGSTGSPKDITVNNGAFVLGGLVSGVYGNFAVTNDGCTGRNNTEVTLLSTPFTLVKSITTGSWESSTTWNVGRVPKAGDVVIIDGGHAVTINANSTIKDMEVRGTLIYGAVGIIINLGVISDK